MRVRRMNRKTEQNSALRRRRGMMALTVLLCLLALLSCLCAVQQFVPLGKFEVEGNVRYTPEELIAVCGVSEGQRLAAIDPDALEEAILAECPFVKTVKVQRKFPNRLSVEVEEHVTPWYIQISDAKYALNEDLVVIDEWKDTTGMTRLILPNVKEVISGSVPGFSESETELRKTLELIHTLRTTSFHERLSEVDLQSRFDIKLVVDGTFTVTMGDMSDFAYKLEEVRKVLESDRLAGAVKGTIYAADPHKGVAVSVEMPEGSAPLPDGAEGEGAGD